MSKLESLGPACTARVYLEARRDEFTNWTLKPHKYQLRVSVEWCEESGADDLTKLDGRDPYEFCIRRRGGNFGVEDGETLEEIAPVTLKSQLTTPWVFLRFAANIHAVPEDSYEQVSLPKLSGTNDVSDPALESDRVTDILEYLHRHHYTSRRHIESALPWETDARMGAIRSLDLHDLDLDNRMSVIRYKHRPDQGAPTKNGEKEERFNSVSDRVGTMLQTYIDGSRVDKVDEFGRKPLLTTSHGRVSANTTRQDMYVVTHPCWLDQGCPHNRDIEMRKAVGLSHISTYPSSRSPRGARKRAVTLYRREEALRRVVSDHLDTSDLVLDKHYDHRGEREQAEQQQSHLPWQNNECSIYPNTRGGLYTSFTEPLQRPSKIQALQSQN